MNYGILCDLVFPEHRHTRHTGNYSHTAPYGEIFDILSPNMPGRSIDPKIFEGYKVLFALGGLEIDAAFARQLEDYVRGGGTLVLNVEDLGQLSPSLFGVAVGQGERKGSKVRCGLEHASSPRPRSRSGRWSFAARRPCTLATARRWSPGTRWATAMRFSWPLGT